MGKEDNVKSRNKKNTIKKSIVLKYLSYLMIFVAFLQIVVVGLQIVYFYKMSKMGNPYSWLVIINETVIFTCISILEMLMGLYGRKGAEGDRTALKDCRTFSILAVATTTLYVFVAIFTKSEETVRLISQFIYPLAFYFVTFIPNLQNQMEKDAAKAAKKKEKTEKSQEKK